jgi:hypothetical protein
LAVGKRCGVAVLKAFELSASQRFAHQVLPLFQVAPADAEQKILAHREMREQQIILE